MFERLESRRLMSATLLDNVVRVLGTEAADRIRIEQQGDLLAVIERSARSTFPVADLVRVEAAGLAGDDRILASPRLMLPCYFFGGDGNDRISAGGADDILDGQEGNDVVSGRGGNDRLRGWTGDDRLLGGPGNDAFYDRDGRDLVDGGPGADGAWVDQLTDPVRRAEAITYHSWDTPNDPAVAAYASRSNDGAVSVIVEATHPTAGFQHTFADLRPVGRSTLLAELTTTGQGASTTTIETDTHTYLLGPLSPRKYQLIIQSEGRTLAVLRIGVARAGLTPDTPTAATEP